MKILGSYPKTRLRRLRKSQWLRDIISENNVSHNDLILPIFIREGKNKIDSIKSLPGIKRYSINQLPKILNQVKKYKIPMVALFHFTPNNKKDNFAFKSYLTNNKIQKDYKKILSDFQKRYKEYRSKYFKNV